MKLNTSKLSRAEVLQRLFNAAAPSTSAVLWLHSPAPMTTAHAQETIDERKEKEPEWSSLRFDFLFGRVLLIDLGKEPLDATRYDRDHGHGAAARALGLTAPEPPSLSGSR